VIDKIIIKALLSKSNWDKYFCVIDEKYYKINCKELYFILNVVKDLRGNGFADKDITGEDLSLAIHQRMAHRSEDDLEVYKAYIEEITKTQYDSNLVEGFFKSHLEQAKAAEVAAIAIDVTEGKRPWEDLSNYIEAKTEKSPFDVEFVTDDLSTLYNTAIKTQGLRWRLDFLNQAVGSLRKGDFGFIFARPETGKTTFLASEVTNMAEQLFKTTGKPAVWANNEEAGSKVKLLELWDLL